MKKTALCSALLLMTGMFVVPPGYTMTEEVGGKVVEDTGIKTGQIREDPSLTAPLPKSTYTTTTSTTMTRGHLRNNMVVADNLIGSEVRNQDGQRIGEIDKVVIDVPEGRVGYVLVSSGGVLGTGTDRYVVPFNALQVSSPNAFTVQLNKNQLMKAPAGDIETVLNQDEGRQIHQYYGVAPYWEERSTTTTERTQRMEMRHDTEHGGSNY